MIWNPWKRIRELERALAVADADFQAQQEWAERRIGDIIHSHYQRIQYEDRHRIAQIQVLQKTSLDLINTQPNSFFIRRERDDL